jgi:hypothetical protein
MAAAKTAEPAPAAASLLTATVARGRTVMHAGRAHGPGTVLQLSVDEHAHLLSTGFLVDPRVPQLTPGIGPQFNGPVNGVVRPL